MFTSSHCRATCKATGQHQLGQLLRLPIHETLTARMRALINRSMAIAIVGLVCLVQSEQVVKAIETRLFPDQVVVEMSHDGDSFVLSDFFLDGPVNNSFVSSREGDVRLLVPLPESQALFGPRITDISGSGEVVVGWESGADGQVATIWDAHTGQRESLPFLPGTHSGTANGVSYDGSFVVGRSYRWTIGGPILELPPINGFEESRTSSVTADGRVVVGHSQGRPLSTVSEYEATMWIDHGDGDVEAIGLGRPDGKDTYAWYVSANGAVVVGSLSGCDGCTTRIGNEAFRWTESDGMAPLGLLSGTLGGKPSGITGDGSVIVGNGVNTAVNSNFRANGEPMFVWDEQHGMRDLEAVLMEQHGVDAEFFPDVNSLLARNVSAISDDGTALGGSFVTKRSLKRLGWAIFLDRPIHWNNLVGDYNNNDVVEQADLDLVLLNWGSDVSSLPDGWIKHPSEGTVDQDELDAVLLNWGNAPALGTAAVPEPGTATLGLVTVALLAWRWRRRWYVCDR